MATTAASQALARPLTDVISNNVRLLLQITDRLLTGIPAEIASSFPTQNGSTVMTNHPAFVLGHLALYPANMLKKAQLDVAGAEAPGAYTELFDAGKECKHDPSRTIYPHLPELVDVFRRTHGVLHERLPMVGDAALAADNLARDGKRSEMNPTVGHALVFMTTTHAAMHLGQVSAWRRMMGLGPAFK